MICCELLLLLLDVGEAHPRYYAALAALLNDARRVHLVLDSRWVGGSRVSVVSSLHHLGRNSSVLLLRCVIELLRWERLRASGEILSGVLLQGQILEQVLVHHCAAVCRVEDRGLLWVGVLSQAGCGDDVLGHHSSCACVLVDS